MDDVETVSWEIAEALGDDILYLQPADEQRFDPVSVGVVVGLWVLRAVAEGIREGIKEAAADKTKSALPIVGSSIKRHLPRWIRGAFSRRKVGPPTDQERSETQKELLEAADAGRSLGAGDRRDLPPAVASAVREALGAEGLPEAAAHRVEQVLLTQIQAALA